MVIPGSVPQFDRLRIIGELVQKMTQTIPRVIVAMKACWELKQEAAQPSGVSKRRNAFAKRRDVLSRHVIALVSKLLPDFDSEIELRRRALDPALCGLWAARTVKRGVHFHGIEVPRVELELVDFFQRIENAGPGTGPTARRVAPAAGADPPDPGVTACRQLSWGQRRQREPALAALAYPE